MNIYDILTGFFALTGSFVLLIGGIGLFKMPDTYCRTNLLATSTGFGLTLLTLAVLFNDLTLVNIIKACIAIPVLLSTSAVAGVAINRTSYLNNVPFAPATQYDELAQYGIKNSSID